MTRSYDMTNRDRMAEETSERILEATELLLADLAPGALTLQAIAEGAGVTVRTVLRHFGSRDGCIEAVHRRVGERVTAQRGGVPPGRVDEALDALLAHYEEDGRLVLNLLAHESSDPAVGRAVSVGRAYHRAWVERCFGPLLGDAPEASVVDALVAATDLYLWKLLRLDLGRTGAEVRDTIERLVLGVLGGPAGDRPAGDPAPISTGNSEGP